MDGNALLLQQWGFEHSYSSRTTLEWRQTSANIKQSHFFIIYFTPSSNLFPDCDCCSSKVQDRHSASRRRDAAHRHQPGAAVVGVHGKQGGKHPSVYWEGRIGDTLKLTLGSGIESAKQTCFRTVIIKFTKLLRDPAGLIQRGLHAQQTPLE